MELIIAAILGAACGFGIAWLVIHKLPQDKIREINYERLQEEQELFQKQQRELEAKKREKEMEIQELELRHKNRQKDYEEYILTNNQKIDEILHEVNALQIQKNSLDLDISHLIAQRQDISNNLEQSKIDAEKTAQTFLDQQMALTAEQLDRALEEIAKKYQEDEEACKQYYLQTMQDYVNQFQKDIQVINQSKENLQIELSYLQHNVKIAVEAAKREEAKRTKKDFYRLILPESDLYEIAQLRTVEPYLRDKEALNKVIWKVYYEKPYTDMIGRVLGTSTKTGIYKITNITNQMCYVGQAVSVAERWKQHIKRGLGAETPTRNKLYPAMNEHGVENFTFELLEECNREILDEREDYWQDFYHAKDFGYSIK